MSGILHLAEEIDNKVRKMIRKLLILLSIVCNASVLYAGPVLKFVNNYFVTDTVPFEQKELVCEIPYTNTGDSPLYLVNTKVFCSCMKTEFSEEALLPGDTAFMKVTYTFIHDDEFRNPIWVYYNSEDPDDFVQVTVIGFVTPKKPDEDL